MCFWFRLLQCMQSTVVKWVAPYRLGGSARINRLNWVGICAKWTIVMEPTQILMGYEVR